MATYEPILDEVLVHTHPGDDITGGTVGGAVPVRAVNFSTNSSLPVSVGQVAWNVTDGTIDVGLAGDTIKLAVGQEQVVRVVNKTGNDLLKANYQVVRARRVAEGGAQGQRVAVLLAKGDGENGSNDILGLVAENIANNQTGFISISGEIDKINTTGSLQGESWSDGDILYLSPTTAGGLTTVAPQAPDHLVVIGYVEYAHVNQGKILIAIRNSWELGELHNVRITEASLTQNQVLAYMPYNASISIWQNTNAANLSLPVFMQLDVSDTASVNFTYSAPTLSAVVIPSGIPHNSLASLQGGTIDEFFHLSGSLASIASRQANGSLSGYLSNTDWNTFNSKQDTISVSDTSSVDLTLSTNTISATVLPAGVDHNSLADLTTGDPHTQYALLAGRLYGQALNGGTAASEPLTLSSTSDATKGNIYFGSSVYDEANNRLGIRTTTPTALVDVKSTTDTNERMATFAEGNATAAQLSFWQMSRNSTGSDVLFAQLAMDNTSTAVKTASIDFRYAAESGANVDTQSDIAFSTGSTERMRIMGLTGRVGIGTSSPDTTLHVVGSGTISTGLNIGTATGAGAGQVSQKASIGTLANILENTSTSANVFSGFVFRLDNQPSQEEFRFGYSKNSAGADTGTGTLLFRKQSTDGTTAVLDLMSITGTNDISFLAGFSSGTPDAYGKVGIYTNTPNYDLTFGTQANRTIAVGDSTTIAGKSLTVKSGNTSGGTTIAGGALTLEAGTGTGTAASNITFRTGQVAVNASTSHVITERMRLNNEGQLLLGATAGPSSFPRFHIIASVIASITGTRALQSNQFYAQPFAGSATSDIRTYNLDAVAFGSYSAFSLAAVHGNSYNDLDVGFQLTINQSAFVGTNRMIADGGSVNNQTYRAQGIWGASAGGSVTSYSNFYSATWSIGANASPKIGRAHGIYLEGLNASYATLSYGVYQAGANDDNYFAGFVGLGVTSPTASLHFADADDIQFGTTTGTKIGTATTQKLAFYGDTPIVQRSGAAQNTLATNASLGQAVSLINELRLSLVNLGLIKGTA